MKWLLKEPSYGDMIRVELGGIFHFGIYVSDDEVIQFGLPPHQRQNIPAEEVEVLASDIDTFLSGGFLEVCRFDKSEKKKNRSAEETVRYARSKLGSRGYNILYNNCEHFANACVSGVAFSDQTERVRQFIRSLPVVDVYLAQLPEGDVEIPLENKARWEYVAAISNSQVKREKYFVWRLLEYALERSFGAKASKLAFRKDSNGRWYTDGYEFSLTHSGKMLAVAVSRGAVGVDIEVLRTCNADKLAEKILTDREKQGYSAQTADDQSRYLIRMWTSKEAIFKSLCKDVFRPNQLEVAAYSLKHGEIRVGDQEYLWSVATASPEVLRVYSDINLSK